MDVKAQPRRRWPWIIAAAIVLVAVAVPFVVATVVDPERFRGRIEQALRSATGWEAELGELDLSLWRGMALTVSPATLRAPAVDGSRVDVETIAVRAALVPLLRGELHVQSLTFDGVEASLVRPAAAAGWSLPRPGAEPPGSSPPGPPPSAQGESGEPRRADAAPSALEVSIDRIAVTGGRLMIEDRAAQPPSSLSLVDLELTYEPGRGSLRGQATLEGGGSLAWRGSFAEGVTIDVEELPTAALHPLLGPELFHAGGRLSGELRATLPGSLDGELTGESIVMLAGERPLDEFAASFALRTPDAGRSWRLDRLTLDTDGVRATGQGTLAPAIALELVVPPADLDKTLDAAASILPLPLQFVYPGVFEATLRVDAPPGGELAYDANGKVTAAGLVLGEALPPVRGVLATFDLARDGSLEVDVEQGTLASGGLSGTARLDSIADPGPLVFEGEVREATFGQLLAGFVGERAARIGGSTGLELDIGIDLGRETIDARAVRGRLELDASEVTLPGWDLERAVRQKLEQAGSGLGRLTDLLRARRDGASAPAEPVADAADAVEQLMRGLVASVSFDGWPWRIERLGFETDSLSLAGAGSFDPVEGRVDLELVARVDADDSAELVRRVDELELLLGADGRIVLPLAVSGALTAPTVRIDLARALRDRAGGGEADRRARLEALAREALDETSEPGDEDDEAVRGLVRGLLERAKKKKDDGGPP